MHLIRASRQGISRTYVPLICDGCLAAGCVCAFVLAADCRLLVGFLLRFMYSSVFNHFDYFDMGAHDVRVGDEFVCMSSPSLCKSLHTWTPSFLFLTHCQVYCASLPVIVVSRGFSNDKLTLE